MSHITPRPANSDADKRRTSADDTHKEKYRIPGITDTDLLMVLFMRGNHGSTLQLPSHR